MLTVQLPAPLAVVVPIDVTPLNSSISALLSEVPVKVRFVVVLVMLSLLLLPVSSAAARSGVDGVPTAVRIVTASAPDDTDVFPAASVACAVIECAPAANATSIVHAPPALAAVVPSNVAPSKSETVLKFSAVPLNVRPVV